MKFSYQTGGHNPRSPRIKTARVKTYGDAVTDARKAVDAVDGKVPDRQAERQIAAIRKQVRTLAQPLGMLRHALHGLASRPRPAMTSRRRSNGTVRMPWLLSPE